MLKSLWWNKQAITKCLKALVRSTRLLLNERGKKYPSRRKTTRSV